ncbi:hypothetical protein ABGB17_09525 [Sphaerisporangium sp. B11E5]|uniref:hypothetical protein n=1 Tax=Sphaerisporangium sp. B11E5 TaxID=3153563 RepID=UPI00325DB4E1
MDGWAEDAFGGRDGLGADLLKNTRETISDYLAAGPDPLIQQSATATLHITMQALVITCGMTDQYSFAE